MKHKAMKYIIITIVTTVFLFGLFVFVLGNNNRSNNNVSENAFISDETIPDKKADDLENKQIEALKILATDFYQKAYQKNYTDIEKMMTPEYVLTFENTLSNNNGGVTGDGTDLLVDLSNYSSLNSPQSADYPVKTGGESDYLVRLSLEDSKKACIGFVKENDTFKVSTFSMQSADKGNGGKMGNHEK